MEIRVVFQPVSSGCFDLSYFFLIGVGTEDLAATELKGEAAAADGFLSCLGFFTSLLLRA